MFGEHHGIRFLAPDGQPWTVYEIRDRRAAGATTSLIFVSDAGFRRVRRYPSDWRTLAPDALWDLSWTR